jgi:hypothetical protein
VSILNLRIQSTFQSTSKTPKRTRTMWKWHQKRREKEKRHYREVPKEAESSRPRRGEETDNWIFAATARRWWSANSSKLVAELRRAPKYPKPRPNIIHPCLQMSVNSSGGYGWGGHDALDIHPLCWLCGTRRPYNWHRLIASLYSKTILNNSIKGQDSQAGEILQQAPKVNNP